MDSNWYLGFFELKEIGTYWNLKMVKVFAFSLWKLLNLFGDLLGGSSLSLSVLHQGLGCKPPDFEPKLVWLESSRRGKGRRHFFRNTLPSFNFNLCQSYHVLVISYCMSWSIAYKTDKPRRVSESIEDIKSMVSPGAYRTGRLPIHPILCGAIHCRGQSKCPVPAIKPAHMTLGRLYLRYTGPERLRLCWQGTVCKHLCISAVLFKQTNSYNCLVCGGELPETFRHAVLVCISQTHNPCLQEVCDAVRDAQRYTFQIRKFHINPCEREMCTFECGVLRPTGGSPGNLKHCRNMWILVYFDLLSYLP